MAGFGGNLIQWFDSYLTRRKQRLTVLGATSSTFSVTSGVSQGFMLGPVLFTLYVKDLSNVVEFDKIAMFPDDTILLSTIKTEKTAKTYKKMTWTTCKFGRQCLASRSTTRNAKPNTRPERLRQQLQHTNYL